jgi:hypothetical protein
MASWHRAHSDKCFSRLLIPELTSVCLLESESGFEIGHRKTTIFIFIVRSWGYVLLRASISSFISLVCAPETKIDVYVFSKDLGAKKLKNIEFECTVEDRARRVRAHSVPAVCQHTRGQLPSTSCNWCKYNYVLHTAACVRPCAFSLCARNSKRRDGRRLSAYSAGSSAKFSGLRHFEQSHDLRIERGNGENRESRASTVELWYMNKKKKERKEK